MYLSHWPSISSYFLHVTSNMAATAQKLKPETTPPEKQPPKLAQLWAKTGLDGKTLSMMFKGSVPPTVAIAMYQSSAVAGHFGVLGYLIASEFERERNGSP